MDWSILKMKILPFKQFFNESVEINSSETLGEMAKFVDEYCKNHKNKNIIWRGFNGRSIGAFSKITNDRKSSKGQIFNVIKFLLKELNLKYGPTSCTTQQYLAKFFGKPEIFIPVSEQFRSLYSEDVGDMAHLNSKFGNKVPSDEEAKKLASEIAKNYKMINNGFPSTENEIVVDIEKYILVSPSSIIELAKKSKFNKVTKPEDFKTYGDLGESVKNYIWYIKNRQK